MKHYASPSNPEQQEKAEEIRVGIDTFTPKTDLSVGDWRRELDYEVPRMIQDVWKHELKDDYYKFLDHYDKELKFGDTLTNTQKEDFRLLLFIFRKVASVNPKAPTPVKGLECRF